MSELSSICRALREATGAGEPTWLATVVGVEGSAYRRPGARLLFGRDGVLAGSLSAGCIDRDVVRSGAWSSEDGPVLRSYDASTDDSQPGSRSGCGGKLRVLIEPVSAELARLFEIMGQQLELERRIALATVVSGRAAGPRLGERLLQTRDGVHGELSGSGAAAAVQRALQAVLAAEGPRVESFDQRACEALLETVEPAPHCFVFGAGEDAVPLVRFARLLEWRVTVCAPSRRFSVGDRFAGLAELKVDPLAACIAALNRCGRPLAFVMAHDYERDREALAALLGSGARYVGVLGPARRTAQMLAEIAERTPVAKTALAPVHGPAGLHLGSETAPEIALSMIAEAQACLAGADARSLRDRKLGIHERQSRPWLDARSA